MAGGGASAGTGLLAAALAALAVFTRRRRRLAKLAGSTALVALGVGLSARPAQAAKPGGVTAPLDALEGNSKGALPGQKDPAGAFFGRIALGAAYDKPGFSGGLGLRYQMSKPFMIGFDAEWNPWMAVTPGKVRPGSANGYFSLIRRFQLRSDSVNIRSTASLGASYLLFDLVGAPKGSIGPFFGLSLLGVEWKMARGFYLTIDPSYLAFPIPHLTGTPFGYLQYRFLVGLEFGG